MVGFHVRFDENFPKITIFQTPSIYFNLHEIVLIRLSKYPNENSTIGLMWTFYPLEQLPLNSQELMVQIFNIFHRFRNGQATYTLDEGNVKRVELIKQFKVVDTFRSVSHFILNFCDL